MTSRAQKLYHQIVSHDSPRSILMSMIAEKETESEFLEFKRGMSPEAAKGLFSKALSGFGNTEGGVQIWGIQTAKIKDPHGSDRQIECAKEPKLVHNTVAMADVLNSVLPQACNPHIAGVEIRQIESETGDGSGFVVCLIPEGLHKPYRAELDDRKQYYLRISDKFLVICSASLESGILRRSG